MSPVPVADHAAALRLQVSEWRMSGQRIALVPTMGALHEGHVSLAKLAKDEADKVVASIFVNPTQFAPTEDLSKYPRTFAEDLQKLAGLADLVFAPSVEEMYPAGDSTRVRVSGPASAASRTASVRIISRVSRRSSRSSSTWCSPTSRSSATRITSSTASSTGWCGTFTCRCGSIAGPTLREPSGLAMSSRNRYLSAEDREHAAILYQTLVSCADGIRSGDDRDAVVEAGLAVLSKANFQVDYSKPAMPKHLRPGRSIPRRPLRLLLAAKLGTTRLIDNRGRSSAERARFAEVRAWSQAET